MQKIILASQSPRRKELLEMMGLKFAVVPSNFDEQLDNSRLPEEVAKELALGKAMAVAHKHPSNIVIGADQIVFLGRQQYGKPENVDEAREMLKSLGGKTHGVVTGLVVLKLDDGIKLIDSQTSAVHFKPFNEAAVEKYVSNNESIFGMAGGYGIQAGAASLVDYIEGDLDNVIGLPTELLSEMLKKFGVKSRKVFIDLPIKLTSINSSPLSF